MIYRGRPAEPLFDLSSMTPAQLEAVEFYSSAMQVPARYGNADAVCGVLALWTRRSR